MEETKPIPMLLFCPMCNARHIDEGDFATKPHHTHACQNMECGMVWRPAIVPTVGVRFLPGFNNAINKLEAWTDQQVDPAKLKPKLSMNVANPSGPVAWDEEKKAIYIRTTRETADVVLSIFTERDRQRSEWGGAQHDDEHAATDWLDFMSKQGQRARALDKRMSKTSFEGRVVLQQEFRARIVKIAALSFAALESLARKSIA